MGGETYLLVLGEAFLASFYSYLYELPAVFVEGGRLVERSNRVLLCIIPRSTQLAKLSMTYSIGRTHS